MNNTAVELQKLRGEIEKLNIKLDNFVTQNEKLNQIVYRQENDIAKRLKIEDFEVYKDKVLTPVIDWVEERISQEKLIVGLLGFLGFSNVVMLIIFILDLL